MTHQEDSYNPHEGVLDPGGIDTPAGIERSYDIVYLSDEGVLGVVLSHGAYFSTVYYVKGGQEFEVQYDNEDLESM